MHGGIACMAGGTYACHRHTMRSGLPILFLQRSILLVIVPVVASCASRRDSPHLAGGSKVAEPPSARLLHPALETAEEPKIKAGAWCLMDAATGEVLAGRRAWEKRPVASTQKLLTALVVAEAGSLEKAVTIIAEDVEVRGSVLDLQPGDRVSRMDLLKALLVVSANDAALALARDVGGSVKAFAEQMNRRADSLGAKGSRFVNPHGLTRAGQKSTAQDLALIARAAYAHPLLREIMRSPMVTIDCSQTERELHNTNELLGRLPGCTGMKTGITPGAGVCLVSSMRQEGREVILVQLDSTRKDIYTDAARAMWWGLKTGQP